MCPIFYCINLQCYKYIWKIILIRVGIGIPKYRKYGEIPMFNNIEYRKCSIPKFQYYWILKKFQYWSSILPKVSVLVTKIPKFHRSLILREKKLRIWFFWLFFIILSILGYFRYFSGFNTENVWYWKKKFKKNLKFILIFFFSENF